MSLSWNSLLFLLILKVTGNNFPMENQNLSFLLTAESGGSERGGTGTIHGCQLTRILNYVTVQGIVTEAFDQVITEIKSRISHTSDIL